MLNKQLYLEFVNHRGNYMDTIGNILTSLINAQKVGKKRIVVPYSKHTESFISFLQQKGLVAKVRLKDETKRELLVTLAYEGKAPRIHGVRRLSRPGQRRYSGKGEIPYSFDGVGMVIISTSKGLLDDKTARKQGMGGELLCEVW